MALLRIDLMSQSLRMETGVFVTLPDEGRLADSPVIYLLHGLTDNCTGWQRYTQAELFARDYGAILIMPEVQRSFYTDMAEGPAYFSYIHDELPALCEQYLRLENRPEHTYLMGLSMGGYGAMKCAFTTPERYAGCAAFSAVADICSAMRQDKLRMNDHHEISAIFGTEYISDKEDLFALAKNCAVQHTMPRLFLTCGQEDDLFAMNCRLRDTLQKYAWPLEWRERPGCHSWHFWNESLRQAMEWYLGHSK